VSKELLQEALDALETNRPSRSQHISDRAYLMAGTDRDAALHKLRAAIAAPEPYDQTALELCEACGWKTLVPGDGCLNCTRAMDVIDREPLAIQADLTDADMVSIAYDCNALPEVITDETLLTFGRALLAAQKAKNET
jgi:hypothetical protein